MAIVVEDGTGKSTAESYISVADASSYFTARAVTTWAALATDALREAALRKATDYMENTYTWQGTRKTEEQALSWPRYNVIVSGYLIDDDIVPEAVKRACAELALKSTTADLSPDITQGVTREKVGPIEVEYDKSSPRVTKYTAIDAMLSGYLSSGSGSGCSIQMRLERV
jgi:hypothetical protein